MSLQLLEKFGYKIRTEENKVYNYNELLVQKQLLDGFKGFTAYIVTENDDDYGRVILIPDNTQYFFRLIVDRNKKCHFELDFQKLREYYNIDYYILNEALKELKEPNYIGSFNQKKINDWFEYLYNKILISDKVLAELQNKNTEIENSINNFISSFQDPNVYKWDNKVQVKTKYFTVVFIHHKSSKSLSTNIQYHGGLENVIKLENQIKK